VSRKGWRILIAVLDLLPSFRCLPLWASRAAGHRAMVPPLPAHREICDPSGLDVILLRISEQLQRRLEKTLAEAVANTLAYALPHFAGLLPWLPFSCSTTRDE